MLNPNARRALLRLKSAYAYLLLKDKDPYEGTALWEESLEDWVHALTQQEIFDLIAFLIRR